ncbi:MAG: radical SAM protein [Gemmatimonadales bacterium]
MARSADDRRIRSLRGPKRAVDPDRPIAVLLETERRGPPASIDGGAAIQPRMERSLAVFLAGAECAFTCNFCDLWRDTLDGPTPPGALPRQLEAALATLDPADPVPDRIKLYNSSNFFDPRAVPDEDLERLAALVDPFAGVTVESHARTVAERSDRWAERLPGRLEVAIGLETVHPSALAALNKRVTVPDFDRAAARLARLGAALRAFVLVGVPFIPSEERAEWAVRSVRHALAAGAAVVSVIPVRGGNGELERLEAGGQFAPPVLADLEAVIDDTLDAGPGVVLPDLWDAARHCRCPGCGAARVERLARMAATGLREGRIGCPVCGGRT